MAVTEPTSRYLADFGTHQTEVGQLPSDWSAVSLADLLISKQLGGNYKNGADETAWPLIKMGNLGRGRIDDKKIEYVHPPTLPSMRDRLKMGDVLFNTRNTLDLVGKVAIWRDEVPEAYFNSNLMRMGFDPNRVGSNAYMNYALNTSRSVSAFRAIATGTTSVAAIYSRDFTNVFLPVPSSREEQLAIAEALTDVDALIESLEQLLTKKREIKQGAMQELLTGKRRLPNFAEPVSMVTLGAVCRMQSGGTPTASQPSYFGGLHPWVAISDITQASKYLCATERSLSEAGLNASPAQLFPAGTVLYAMYASVGECCIAAIPACTSQAILAIQPTCVLDAEYLYYWLSSTKAQAKSLAQRGTQGNLNKGIVQATEIRLPQIAEQKAIARLLSDMDADLDALESRMTKARDLKQAIAQALLTGRIRLVEPQAA